MRLDVEDFLTAAAEGLRLHAEGLADVAAGPLREAEAAYLGDFLEEDAYEDWTQPLREEAADTYVQILRTLAEQAAAAGETDAATRRLLRILERDPYDEAAHLRLVSTLSAAGRHGEAARFFRAYSARMAEVGVEPAPFPGSSQPSR